MLAINKTLFTGWRKLPHHRSYSAAAENGKRFRAGELKARFDEENDVLWAEEAGKGRLPCDLWPCGLKDQIHAGGPPGKGRMRRYASGDTETITTSGEAIIRTVGSSVGHPGNQRGRHGRVQYAVRLLRAPNLEYIPAVAPCGSEIVPAPSDGKRTEAVQLSYGKDELPLRSEYQFRPLRRPAPE